MRGTITRIHDTVKRSTIACFIMSPLSAGGFFDPGAVFGVIPFILVFGWFAVFIYTKEILFFLSLPVIVGSAVLYFAGKTKWGFRLLVAGALALIHSVSWILFSATFIEWSAYYYDFYMRYLPKLAIFDHTLPVFGAAALLAFVVGIIVLFVGIFKLRDKETFPATGYVTAGILTLLIGIDVTVITVVSAFFALTPDLFFAFGMLLLLVGPLLTLFGIIFAVRRKKKWAIRFLVIGAFLFLIAPSYIVASSFREGWWW